MLDARRRFANRLFFGLSFIGLGVLFTLDNLGLVHARDVLHWWPGLLVVYGLLRIAGVGRRPSLWVGLAFVSFGGWGMLHAAHLVRLDMWDLWPVLLIVWGISMIRGGSTVWRIGYYPRSRGGIGGEAAAGEDERQRVRERVHEQVRERVRAVVDASVGERLENLGAREEPSSTFSVDVFLSSVVRKVTALALTRGSVVALLGGADIDLRSARMASGSATLEVNMVMGGLNLVVPEDWVVDYQGAQVMGSIEDHSKPPAGEPRGRLVINGVVLLSSVVIKN